MLVGLIIKGRIRNPTRNLTGNPATQIREKKGRCVSAIHYAAVLVKSDDITPWISIQLNRDKNSVLY